MSTLEARVTNLGSDHFEAAVERYAVDLGQAVGVLEAAELMVAAGFTLFYRAEGGERTRSFARTCYWSVIEATH